jgi:hypothetical protein
VLFIVILGPAAIRVMAIQDTSSKAPITKSSAK